MKLSRSEVEWTIYIDLPRIEHRSLDQSTLLNPFCTHLDSLYRLSISFSIRARAAPLYQISMLLPIRSLFCSVFNLYGLDSLSIFAPFVRFVRSQFEPMGEDLYFERKHFESNYLG
jgi:hypothetical protein